jgi:hypothetical protein
MRTKRLIASDSVSTWNFIQLKAKLLEMNKFHVCKENFKIFFKHQKITKLLHTSIFTASVKTELKYYLIVIERKNISHFERIHFLKEQYLLKYSINGPT